jgi:V8-like Glu-specific endopeptidase
MLRSLAPALFLTLPLLAHANNPSDLDGVIGKDDRYQITERDLRKTHLSVGQLVLKYSTGSSLCSGTVIGKRHVLTAAHCLWEKGEFPSRVDFYPGSITPIHTSKNKYGKHQGVSVRIHPNYPKAEITAYDLGLIYFAKDLPVPALPIAEAPSGLTLPFYELIISGYPGDKETGTLWEARGYMKTNPVLGSSAHTLDTVAGMSGASIRTEGQVIAVHSGGQMDSKGRYVFNYANFLTESRIALLRKWLKD